MPVTFSWFNNTDPFNPISPLSYTKIPGLPNCCVGTAMVCAIYAQVDTNNKPIITTALSNEITTALNTRTNTTNVKLRH